MTNLIHPVILCGGSGTRLWPVSRKSYPKQFSRLMGEESLFQNAAQRLSGAGFAPPTVVTRNDFRFIVTEQLAACEIGAQAILIEPDTRDTAPAILAAALTLAKAETRAMMLVTPADHLVPDWAVFSRAIAGAVGAAREGRIVAFGVPDLVANAAHGLFELADDADVNAEVPLPLAAFLAPPVIEGTGLRLGNAGVFLMESETLIQAFRRHSPATLAAVESAVVEARQDLGFTRLAALPWSGLADQPIEQVVMGDPAVIAVMPYAGQWSAIGTWGEVWQETPADGAGNVCSPHATAIDCENSLLRSESEGLELVGIGLRDIVAVATNDAVLVAHRSESSKVREAVTRLKQMGCSQATAFPRDYRPWGWYESLVVGARFQVKRIVVHPGAALSLQSHHHRSEHWIVVEGTAKATVDNRVQLISENQSVYIPLGAVHRMENPGKIPMVMIEVQTGTYLGEDDIVRYEDLYARN